MQGTKEEAKMKVIDISEHNGSINFNKVKADGVEGVVIRAGYGKGNVDKKFTANITGAIKAGLHIGIYWFSYAYDIDMAKREARFCNDIIQPYRVNIDMPVFFDWEYDSMKFAKKNKVTPDKALITAMTKAFCQEIELLGYVGGYYLNLDYSKNYYDENKLSAYKRWFARYIKTDQKECYLWQKSSTGTINGISGNVDVNELWGSFVAADILENSAKEIPQKKEEPTPDQGGFVVGRVYTVNVRTALNVRIAPGLSSPKVGYNNLTSNGRKNANRDGALLPGTKVTCLDVKVLSANDVWVKIPSGWVSGIFLK